MNAGTLVEYIGADRMTSEDHRNRSYPLTAGVRGQVLRRCGTEVLVRWDLGEAMPVEWHSKSSIRIMPGAFRNA